MIKFKFESIKEPDFEVNPGRSITFVKISNYDLITKNTMFLYSGYAIKSANEPYNKALGQKYAVADAMSRIAKPNRTMVWYYFKQKYSKASKKIMGN